MGGRGQQMEAFELAGGPQPPTELPMVQLQKVW